MKQLSLTVIAIVALFCSCTKEAVQKDVTNDSHSNNLVEVTFTASIPETKAILNADRSVEFSANDEIAVFANGNKYKFTTTSGGANASFTGQMDEVDASSDTFYALFPYSDDAVWNTTDGKISNVTLAKYSAATPGSFHAKQAVFVAKSTNLTLSFKSAVALLKVTVPDNVPDLKEIAIFNRQTALTGAITGVFDVTPADGTGTPVVEVTAKHGDPHTAGLNVAGEQSYINPGVYYIPVLPSLLPYGLEIKLTFASAPVTARAANGTTDMLLEAGKVYNLGAINKYNGFIYQGFESSNLPVGTKLTDWTGNDVFVRENLHVTSINGSSKVMAMDMTNRSETSATSGYLDHTISLIKFPASDNNRTFRKFFNSFSVKVYFGQDKYYPHMLWNKSGTATLPKYVNGNEITDKTSFDNAMVPDEWNTLEWTYGQFSGKSSFYGFDSVKIRFFVDWDNNTLKREDGYNLLAYIDDFAFNL